MTWSWLASPAVAAVGFLASTVTLGQLAVTGARAAWRLTSDDDQAQAVRIRAAAAGVAAVAILTVLTWAPVVTFAAAHGNGGIVGDFYPVCTSGLALAGALALLWCAIDRIRPPVAAWAVLVGGLAVTLAMAAAS
jgi:hypothetical protein